MKLTDIKSGLNEVTFISKSMAGDLKLAGHLYTPPNFDPNKQYPAIIFTGAFNQIKEQTGAVYGKKLAAKGYVFLAFDHQGYGDSEGLIRNYEYAPSKIEGIQDGISFLRMQDFVNRDRVYGIGLCAGGTHMAYTALTDKRLKKISLVGGMLVNPMIQFIANNRKKSDEILLKANEARQKFYETSTLVPFDALEMDKAPESKLRDVRDGYDYYMTERAGAVTNPNYTPHTPEFYVEDMPRHSARAIARYITTPVLTIYGTKASTKIFSWLFHFSLKRPKKRVAIKGAYHVDLYDVEKYVDQVIDHVAAYFD